MSIVLSVVLALFVIFVIRILLGLRKVARDVGNLSGPFYFFRPDSAVARLIARIARPVRYLNMGTTWTATTKYEEYAIAGRDAVALVISRRTI